jgi:hypothetical protein
MRLEQTSPGTVRAGFSFDVALVVHSVVEYADDKDT